MIIPHRHKGTLEPGKILESGIDPNSGSATSWCGKFSYWLPSEITDEWRIDINLEKKLGAQPVQTKNTDSAWRAF